MNQNELIPFGKYKGQPLDILASDPQYVEWLMQQDWFNSRYASIKTIIINNFQQPAETPEHNKLQAAFTSEDFSQTVLTHLAKRGLLKDRYSYSQLPSDCEAKVSAIQYEIEGVDVTIYVSSSKHDVYPVKIELKPSLSDDYPSVLRQMLANKSAVLVTNYYTGTGATLEQVRKMFAASGKYIILLSDL